jgi:uncharacterized Zn finger protein
MAKERSRFDVDTLRMMAGDKGFARGEVYCRDGNVEILAVEPDRVVAKVAGTDDYRTVLRGRGTEIDGDCTCRAFEDWGFCKHMVATGLVANRRSADGAAEGVGALARIRDFLKGKSVDALVDIVMDLAERDPVLFEKLDMAAAMVNADDDTLEAHLSRAIDSATRTHGLVDYHEAGSWASGVAAALDAVANLASNDRGILALKLIDHAMDRIERAIENIDDSDGHCGALLDQARDIHLKACQAGRPDPVELAHELFNRETGDDYDVFDGAAALYADVLGEAGLAEYRRLATEAWEKLPARVGRAELSMDYDRLQGILDYFAERDGDAEARISLRAKDLSSSWRYLQLAEFALSHGRAEEALRHAEEGLWVFEDERPDERLVFFVVDRLQKAGRKKDAELQLWRAFDKEPSLHLYGRLRKLGGKKARERALARLETRLAEEKPTRWNAPADLLIRVLIEEKMYDAAWAAARKHGASAPLKGALAKASEATHPEEAIGVYVRHVEELVDTGGNAAYEEAEKLVARMAGLRGKVEQAAYVADLKLRYRRKRNFMKLLA